MKSKLLAAAAVLLIGAMPLSAAFDTFLKIEGVDGESLDVKHRGWIEIESFSMGPSLQQATEGGAAKLSQFHEFTFTRLNDKASPKLHALAAHGEHFREATITHRKAGKGQQEFLQYKLENVMISSYQLGAGGPGPGGAAGPDRFTISFTKISLVPAGPGPAMAQVGAASALAHPTATPTPLPRSAPPKR